MPPKRKATTAPGDTSPPLKRRLRSGKGPLLDTQPSDDPPKSATQTRRKPRGKVKANYVSKVEDTLPPLEEAPLPRRRGRLPKVLTTTKPESVPQKTARTEPPRPSSSKETLDSTSHATSAPDPESSDDELLLSPTKGKPISRLVTPPRRQSTPRQVAGQFMEAVEIITPSHFKKPSLANYSAANSPVPSSPRKILPRSPTLETRRHLRKPRASTPPPHVIPTVATPTRPPSKRSSRKVVKDDVAVSRPSSEDEGSSPVLETPPISPSKKGKGRAIASPRKGEPSQDALPESLHSCLRAQKFAIMKALHKSPPFIEQDNDEDDIAANVIAHEQLTELLKGTVVRGEGNSCILTGPPGSGKTEVIISQCVEIISLTCNTVRWLTG